LTGNIRVSKGQSHRQTERQTDRKMKCNQNSNYSFGNSVEQEKETARAPWAITNYY